MARSLTRSTLNAASAKLVDEASALTTSFLIERSSITWSNFPVGATVWDARNYSNAAEAKRYGAYERIHILSAYATSVASAARGQDGTTAIPWGPGWQLDVSIGREDWEELNTTLGSLSGPRGTYVTDEGYEAVGDGIADDTGPIQLALSASLAGDRVVVPTGTYKITSRLAVPSGVSLVCEGTLRAHHSGVGVLFDNVTYQTDSNIRITHALFDHSDEAIISVDVVGADGGKIDVYSKDATTSLRVRAQSGGLSVTNCRFVVESRDCKVSVETLETSDVFERNQILVEASLSQGVPAGFVADRSGYYFAKLTGSRNSLTVYAEDLGDTGDFSTLFSVNGDYNGIVGTSSGPVAGSIVGDGNRFRSYTSDTVVLTVTGDDNDHISPSRHRVESIESKGPHPWYDVTRWGVVDYGTGSGTEDDNTTMAWAAANTTALQACIEAAKARGGGTIYFPKGDYVLLTIELGDNLRLVGETKGLVKLRNASYENDLLFSTEQTANLELVNLGLTAVDFIHQDPLGAQTSQYTWSNGTTTFSGSDAGCSGVAIHLCPPKGGSVSDDPVCRDTTLYNVEVSRHRFGFRCYDSIGVNISHSRFNGTGSPLKGTGADPNGTSEPFTFEGDTGSIGIQFGSNVAGPSQDTITGGNEPHVDDTYITGYETAGVDWAQNSFWHHTSLESGKWGIVNKQGATTIDSSYFGSTYSKFELGDYVAEGDGLLLLGYGSQNWSLLDPNAYGVRNVIIPEKLDFNREPDGGGPPFNRGVQFGRLLMMREGGNTQTLSFGMNDKVEWRDQADHTGDGDTFLDRYAAGRLHTPGDFIADGTLVGKQARAQISFLANGNVTSISTTNPHQVENFTAPGGSQGSAVADYANDKVTTATEMTLTYLYSATITFTGTVGKEYRFMVSSDGGTSFLDSRPAMLATGNLDNITVLGSVSLGTATDVTLWVKNETGTEDVTIRDCVFGISAI